MVNLPTRIPVCGSHSQAFLDFLSSDASICSTMAFPPLGNSDHVVSVSIDFPTNSQQDAPFHRIAYDYFRADWDGLHEFRLKLMYIYYIEHIRSSFIHLHSFQLLVLLP